MIAIKVILRLVKYRVRTTVLLLLPYTSVTFSVSVAGNKRNYTRR